MEIARTSSEPTGYRHALRAACLMVCLTAWSSSGAATPSALVADESHLPGLELATGDYASEADIAGRAASGEDALPDAQVPYLFLTPRVANILENVFGEATEAFDAADTAAAEERKEEAPSTAPVAGNVERPLAPDTPSFDSSAILPRFQRQMYRTDI